MIHCSCWALADEYFTMFTYGPDDATRRMWNIMGTGFIFSVKAAESAIIYLCTKPGQLDKEAFQITIGDDGNEQTRIKRVDVLLHEIQEPTPGILRVGISGSDSVRALFQHITAFLQGLHKLLI